MHKIITMTSSSVCVIYIIAVISTSVLYYYSGAVKS